MKLVFFVGAFLATLQLSDQKEILDNFNEKLVTCRKADPEKFPYHAYVESDMVCLGCLVSEKHVVVPGMCISSKRKAVVYLGTKYNPYYTIEFWTNGGKRVETTLLYTRNVLESGPYLQTKTQAIGLIVFHTPMKLSKTIYPAELPQRYEYQMPRDRTYANLTGYQEFPTNTPELKYMTVRVLSEKKCLQLFAVPRLFETEMCVKRMGLNMDLVGPLVSENVLIGLGTPRKKDDVACSERNLNCDPRDIFLNVNFYITWLRWRIEHKDKTELLRGSFYEDLNEDYAFAKTYEDEDLSQDKNIKNMNYKEPDETDYDYRGYLRASWNNSTLRKINVKEKKRRIDGNKTIKEINDIIAGLTPDPTAHV